MGPVNVFSFIQLSNFRVYFGSVNVTKTRYTLAGALIATAAGTIAAIFLASL